MRVGLGFDVHRFQAGRPLILAGVEIPSAVGLLGHSDADVILHALMDALLGALALGDIGDHFPDTDEQYRGISSMQLLTRVVDLIAARGYVVSNADLMVMAEMPKLSPYKKEMVQKMANALQVNEDQVSLKATTMEGMGFVGRKEGIAAQALVSLARRAAQM